MSISDDKQHILDTFHLLQNKVDIVIVTGGLGPTKDDITKKTFCDYFKDTLVENDAVLINTPVYPPFARTVKLNNRKLIENKLMEKNGDFLIDFEVFVFQTD
jgi:molybdopterin-biosynthesis enzyme MoeA-like protein